MRILFIALLSLWSLQCVAQENESTKTKSAQNIIFPEKCLGIWEGTMYIYNYGHVRDSVAVRFTAAKTDSAGVYIWKTAYISLEKPIVKDYKLIVDDPEKGSYLLDEGDGIKLVEYNVNNKLYCAFKLDDIYLTSSTELIGDKLVFEVTSGKELNTTKGITNYSFANVQRVVLHKVE